MFGQAGGCAEKVQRWLSDLEREVEFDLGGGFVAVEGAVGSHEEFIEGMAVVGVDGDAGADGEGRIFAVVV